MKNFRLVFSVVVLVAIAIFSNSSFAMVRSRIIELQCGEDFLSAPEFRQEGNPYTQLSVETIGIKESGVYGIIDVVKKQEFRMNKDRMLGGSELPVHITADCGSLGSRNGKFISLTGASVVCEKGEKLTLRMFKPNSKNPDQFHAVLRLTETIGGEPAVIEEPKQPEPKPKSPAEVMLDYCNGKLEWWESKGEAETIRYYRSQGFTQEKAKLVAIDEKNRLLSEVIEAIKLRKQEIQIGIEERDRESERQIQEILEGALREVQNK